MSDPIRETRNIEARWADEDAHAAWLRAGCPDDDTIPDDVRGMGGGPFGVNDWLNDIPWETPATPAQAAAISAYLDERRKAA